MDYSFNTNTCEIVETREEIISEFKIDEKPESSCAQKSGKKYSIEDDINRLLQAIDIKNSPRGLITTCSQKSALRKPIKPTSSQASGIDLSEPVSLKQAFRRLCISQASEMAALKRLSKLSTSSRVSEAGISRTSDELGSNENHEISNSSAHHSTPYVNATNPKPMSIRSSYRNQIVPLASEAQGEKLVARLEKQVLADSTSASYPSNELLELGIRLETLSNSSRKDFLSSSMPDKGMEAKLNSPPSSGTSNGVDKPTNSNTSVAKPTFKGKNFLKKKVKQDLCSSSSCPNPCTRNIGNNLASSTSNLNMVTDNSDSKNETKENKKLSFSHLNHSIEVYSVKAGMDSSKPGFCLTGKKRNRFLVTKFDEKSRSKEKGVFSQSPKSSTGDYRSISEESNLSGYSCSGHRPHMSKHARWEAIRVIEQQHGSLSWRNFQMLKRLGRGDIGTVYLAQLIGTSSLFALKVVENDFLVNQKKMLRAQTERQILQMLDHPFLPTLYAHFATDKLSCLVMEYCPGGDLHVLRQRQPCKSFSEQATRFYVAEVLLALEYLHMLGIVYRDLKPENILVREDGHIMLTDFDLSLRCCVNPMLVKSSSPNVNPKMTSSSCLKAKCMHPFCLQPDWQVSCTPILLSGGSKSRKKAEIGGQVGSLPQLIVEPTSARSNSFVGTYEYLAPEIIKDEGHGSAVDWWTFGILLFELLYGKTPFKSPANEDTLANVVSQCLKFPDTPIVSFQARDLIKRLLIKDPENRLGFVKGAAEIRQHSFFEGLNWALIRCAPPPKLPKFHDSGTSLRSMENANDSQVCEEFDMF